MLIRAHGGRDRLELAEIPRPRPGPGQALVAVRACGINHLDVFVRRGMPGATTPLPHIGGGDIAGVIDEVAPDVRGIAAGQRVLVDPLIALPNGRLGALGENVDGGLCEFIAVDAANLIPLPDDVSFVQAAALPIAYGTAWRMLITRGRIAGGEHVLILGAAGGVGTACVQIAHARGCVVYAAARSQEKLNRLKDLGADVLVNYAEHPEFHRHIRGLRGGPGVDVVVDYTGATTWVRSLKALNDDGRLLTCGATSGYDPRTDIRFIWTRELRIVGSDGWRRGDLVELVAAVRAGTLRAVVDRVLPLEQVAEAHRLLEDREVIGKVVIGLG